MTRNRKYSEAKNRTRRGVPSGTATEAARIDYLDVLSRLVGKKREMVNEKVAATNSGNGGLNPGQEDLDCTQPHTTQREPKEH